MDKFKDAQAAVQSATFSPKMMIIINNVSKYSNVGMILRSATAFGVFRVIVVGKKRKMRKHGSFGAARHLDIQFVQSLADAVMICTNQNCEIIGVEIVPDALDVRTHPFGNRYRNRKGSTPPSSSASSSSSSLSSSSSSSASASAAVVGADTDVDDDVDMKEECGAAFILGNEGQGLSDREKNICNRFIFIPQHGGGAACLNVAVSAAIIMVTTYRNPKT